MTDNLCNVCGKDAVVLDTEYSEYYCDEHAQLYNVYDTPHRMLVED